MKFIEHSNSVYKSNKKYVSPKMKKIRKIFIEVILFLILISIIGGIVYEASENNKAIGSLKASHRLGSYNENKIAYGTTGTGDLNVLFEPDIGETLLQWNPVILDPISSLRMFYYDRFGYGGSDIIKNTTVEVQSEVLNNVLNNAGYLGDNILVSIGYGSLIHYDYYKKHNEKVKGMIIIDPITRKIDGSVFNEFINKINLSFKRIFSTFGVLRVLDSISLYRDDLIEFYENNVKSRNKENYISRMFSSSYFSTILSEKNSMKKYLSNINNFDVEVNVPTIIIAPVIKKSSEYEENLKKYFSDLEIIYFEDVENFSYKDSDYLKRLISNMANRVTE